MKFKVERRGIEIVPENDQDVAYIEDTLGLKAEGDFVPLVRQNAIGMGCIADLTTSPFPRKALRDVTASKPTSPTPEGRVAWAEFKTGGRRCALQEDNCKAHDCPEHGINPRT